MSQGEDGVFDLERLELDIDKGSLLCCPLNLNLVKTHERLLTVGEGNFNSQRPVLSLNALIHYL